MLHIFLLECFQHDFSTSEHQCRNADSLVVSVEWNFDAQDNATNSCISIRIYSISELKKIIWIFEFFPWFYPHKQVLTCVNFCNSFVYFCSLSGTCIILALKETRIFRCTGYCVLDAPFYPLVLMIVLTVYLHHTTAAVVSESQSSSIQITGMFTLLCFQNWLDSSVSIWSKLHRCWKMQCLISLTIHMCHYNNVTCFQ
jgi:hypothetical protein